jgi:hypothetical protein
MESKTDFASSANLNQSDSRCDGGEIHMAMLKKKTRKAIRKSFKKAINKYGPDVAQHLATALAAAMATYLGADGKKSRKQLKKVAKTFPGGKNILRAVSSNVPFVKGDSPESNGDGNGDAHSTRKRGRRSKKHETA